MEPEVIEYVRGSDTVPIEVTPTGDSIIARKKTQNQTVRAYHSRYRHLSITVEDGTLKNDGTDTETVTVRVMNGLEVTRGTDPSDATVLGYDGEATVRVDGQQTTKTVSGGSVSFDLTTVRSPGSVIEIVAETLDDHPAESDSATVKVVG